MMSTRLYSYPPFCTKNPVGPCTLAIATAMVPSTNRLASGVSRPSRYSSPAASSPPTARAAQNRAGRKPRLPMNPVAPAKPGPPNAPNAFCAPWLRNTSPSVSRSASNPRSANMVPPPSEIISISRYLTSTYPGTRVPGGRFREQDEPTSTHPAERAPRTLGRPGPGVRRRGTPLAGQHGPLWPRDDGVWGPGSAVPQGGVAGLRGAAAHPGGVEQYDLRGGQARRARPGAAPPRPGGPPRSAARAHARGPAPHCTDLSLPRRGDAPGRERPVAPVAGPGPRPAAQAGARCGAAAAPQGEICREVLFGSIPLSRSERTPSERGVPDA